MKLSLVLVLCGALLVSALPAKEEPKPAEEGDLKTAESHAFGVVYPSYTSYWGGYPYWSSGYWGGYGYPSYGHYGYYGYPKYSPWSYWR